MLPKTSCCLTPSECELFYFPDYFAGVTLLDQILCLGIIQEAEGSPWGPPEVTGLPGFLIRVPPDCSGQKGGGSSKICGHLAGGVVSLPLPPVQVHVPPLCRRPFPKPGYQEAAPALETCTRRQGKVAATAFSDSFASWIMF